MLNIKEIAPVTIILITIIDIVGSIPVIIDLRKKTGKIQSGKVTIVAGGKNRSRWFFYYT
jgi:multiple antibiotic resistance protein